MKCGRTGCDRHGTHYLTARVWALGCPKSSTPITSVIGMTFCKDHAREEAASHDLISDEFWEIVDTMTSSRGAVPADRASLELVPTRGDPEQAINQMRARQ